VEHSQRGVDVPMRPDANVNVVVMAGIGRQLQAHGFKAHAIVLPTVRACCSHRMSGRLPLRNGTKAIPGSVLVTMN